MENVLSLKGTHRILTENQVTLLFKAGLIVPNPAPSDHAAGEAWFKVADKPQSEQYYIAMIADMLNTTPPSVFSYERWRHGGWYVGNVRYPTGAVGCVSRNYADRKWRIVCDERPFEERPTFTTRDAAALAEWHLIHDQFAK